MTNKNKAIEKMAKRVLQGYEAVHEKNYAKAIQLLEPLRSFMHREERPNVLFLSYLTIAQLGNKDIENFLRTYEELQKYEPINLKEKQLKKRVDDLFIELMETMKEDIGE